MIIDMASMAASRSQDWVWDNSSVEACHESIATLQQVASSPTTDVFLQHLLNLVLDHLYVLRVVRVACEAGITFARLKPSEFYLRLVTAFPAVEFEQGVIEVVFRHGWPILSIANARSGAAEPVAASSMAHGGMA